MSQFWLHTPERPHYTFVLVQQSGKYVYDERTKEGKRWKAEKKHAQSKKEREIEKEHKVYTVNATEESKKLGNSRVFNLIVLGIAAQHMDFSKELWYEVIENTKGALLDPQPLVRVISHGESTINIVTRVWTENANYWNVYFDMMESIKKSFDNSNIEIPYNQLDVHIKNK